MFGFVKWLSCVAALAGAVMLGTASPARADIELELTITTSGGSVTATYDYTTGEFLNSGGANGNGSGYTGSFTTFGSTSSTQQLSFAGTIGGYTVDLSTSTANVPGSSTEAFVNTDNSQVSGTGTGLTITTSAATFTNPASPPAPALLLSTDSSVTGNSSTTTVGYTGSAVSMPSGSDLASVSGSYTVQSSSATGSGPNLTTTFSSTSYALTDTLNISSGTVSLDVSGFTEVTPLPEPATLMTAFTAVPFLGLGAWLRRRKQVA
jgi:hypothetical protein